MTTTAKNTNAARITALEEKMDKLLALLENQAAPVQAEKPAKSTKKSSKKSKKTEVTKPYVTYEVKDAKNGNGKVIWVKLSKPMCNAQYCVFTNRDAKTFAKRKQDNGWSFQWSNTMKAYHQQWTEKREQHVKELVERFRPATEKELEERKAAFALLKKNAK